MAPIRNYPYGLKVAVAVAVMLVSSLTLLPPNSVGIQLSSFSGSESKMALGSRPPGCVNKCVSCRPCEATLVIPPPSHQRKGYGESSLGEDDNYYLLSWKCRCGDKIYQP